MEKKMIKKLLAVMMIITILATDFFVLGSSLKTYAAQATNEIEGYPNIYFSTYFKEGENEVKQIEKSVKDKELKLYAKIGVNSDVDCLEDIQIQLKDNFDIISTNKGTIEGNTVKLNYIAAGSTVEVELGIEPRLSNKISADMLFKANIELSAKYKNADAPEGEEIRATSESIVKYQPDETTEAELEADIITNKIFAIDGKNQRIIQLLIKSRITNNEYPIKQTTLNVSIPNLSENQPEVSALVIGKLATNGTTQINNMTTENGNLQITLNNEIDENNQISWSKNVYDEIIITYMYPETVDASKIEITANSEIKLHSSGNTYTAKYTKGIQNQEPNSVIIGKTEITTEEMYKGQLYANIDAQYNTKTSIAITNPDVADEVVVHEGPDAFGTTESELSANTKYITTKINLENMLSILGEHGNIAIKNGETRTVINKDSEVDEDGNVVINYENSTSEIDITTSGLVNAGVLEINHIKAITGNAYTREQMKTITTLKSTGSITGIVTVNKEKQEIVSGTTVTDKSSTELKETISKAELTIDRTTFSATESNELTLGIKLITDGTKYDLFKNPSITIKFPETVANIEFVDEPSKLYADEFEITNKSYDSINHIMTLNMTGEQTTYPESGLNQAYIQLKLKMTFAEFVLSQTDKIIMEYKNENSAEQGKVEQTIEISAPSELIKMFNLDVNTNTSLTENILQQVKTEDAGKELNFSIALINNKDTEINNVKILGKLPTTILKGINATKATVYYTENANATEDLENIENGWTQSLLPNAKLYLIKLDKLARGVKYEATVTIQIPDSITENELSYTQYEVIYNTETEETREKSREIGLATSVAANIKVETTAQVGKDNISNGDTVKEGEVIKYKVTVKTSGTEKLSNVKLKLNVPEGTVLVQPIQKYIANQGTESEETIENGGYVYVDGAYYEEITENEKLEELTNIIIPELSTTYETQYEVRINKGTAGTEISNKPIAIYNEETIESEEFKNKIEEANIRVTVKRAVDVSTQLLPSGNSRYIVYVENLSNSKVKDLELKVISEGFTIKTINDNENIAEETKIKEIKAKESKTKNREEDYENGMKSFIIYGDIHENIKEMSISAIVKDSDGKEYRSNNVIEKLPYINGTINMTSPQNNQYIKEGDTVEYNIVIKNTSDIESIIKLSDIIPEYLQVQSIYENKELKMQNVSNNISYSIILQPQEERQIDIIAKVGYISELHHGQSITNIATIKVLGVIESNSEVITHILKSSQLEEENMQNIISGIVWFDLNANGQIDNNEEKLSKASVKLYDTVANHYITDEYGNPTEVITESNGEYVFTKIPAGSYKIMVEYNSERYDFATDINGNVFNMNLGLNEKNKYIQPEEQPGTSEKPEDSENSESTGNTEQTGKPEDSNKEDNTKTISGYAWLDLDRDGQKDDNESILSGIKVKIYDVNTQKYLTETTTDGNGKYTFNNIEKGSYIIIFEFDTEEYETTTYMAEGVDTTKISKAILNNININGQELKVGVTDTINVQDNVSNVNIGLKEKLIFDLQLNKYISKIVVQTGEQTKSYDYDKKSLAKTEIHKKQIQGAIVVIEYTIAVKNTGEISGYAKNIIDYLPSGLSFSSELNTDWYLSGSNLYTKTLENTKLNPGEEKEIKLILTKTMTNDNVGLINNRAEIYQDYNKYGESDIDSTPNNQVQNEDDYSSADVIIQVATGESGIVYIILLMINTVLIGFAIKLMIRTRIIKRPSKKWRR